jgi:glycosyltransferase involved in cell wall biosynthesis
MIHAPLVFWGTLACLLGIAAYGAGVALSLLRLVLWWDEPLRAWSSALLWYSGIPSGLGVLLIAVDLALLPRKRRVPRREEAEALPAPAITVALTAYDDEESIGAAVADFRAHPLVRRVLVVDNASHDATAEHARAAGALVHREERPGYGPCVHRALREALAWEDADPIVLCEGDCTFRARDIDKLLAYQPHADVVNGTRIVEQLRAYRTQLTTFMYYGNFFVGKLLELKHLGRGTFTDVGTTYKMIRRDALARLLPHLDPRVDLEFNAHFLDTALARDLLVVECPITFHARVGRSKGGNLSNLRALRVGLRMILGLAFGWRLLTR